MFLCFLAQGVSAILCVSQDAVRGRSPFGKRSPGWNCCCLRLPSYLLNLLLCQNISNGLLYNDTTSLIAMLAPTVLLGSILWENSHFNCKKLTRSRRLDVCTHLWPCSQLHKAKTLGFGRPIYPTVLLVQRLTQARVFFLVERLAHPEPEPVQDQAL